MYECQLHKKASLFFRLLNWNQDDFTSVIALLLWLFLFHFLYKSLPPHLVQQSWFVHQKLYQPQFLSTYPLYIEIVYVCMYIYIIHTQILYITHKWMNIFIETYQFYIICNINVLQNIKFIISKLRLDMCYMIWILILVILNN